MKIFSLVESLQITGNEEELGILGKILENMRLNPYWDNEGEALILDESLEAHEKIINFLKAYFVFRNLDFEISADDPR